MGKEAKGAMAKGARAKKNASSVGKWAISRGNARTRGKALRAKAAKARAVLARSARTPSANGATRAACLPLPSKTGSGARAGTVGETATETITTEEIVTEIVIVAVSEIVTEIANGIVTEIVIVAVSAIVNGLIANGLETSGGAGIATRVKAAKVRTAGEIANEMLRAGKGAAGTSGTDGKTTGLALLPALIPATSAA